MATPEFNQSFEQTPDDEQTGEYVNITDSLHQLQSALIDDMANYAREYPKADDTALGLHSLEYIEQHIGRDLSHLEWLKRGDELIASGNVSLVLVDEQKNRYLTHLGDNGVLNGHALGLLLLKVPVIEAIPDVNKLFGSLENPLEQWSLAVELSDTVACFDDKLTGEDRTEELGEHLRVFLPLAYPIDTVHHYIGDQ